MAACINLTSLQRQESLPLEHLRGLQTVTFNLNKLETIRSLQYKAKVKKIATSFYGVIALLCNFKSISIFAKESKIGADKIYLQAYNRATKTVFRGRQFPHRSRIA